MRWWVLIIGHVEVSSLLLVVKSVHLVQKKEEKEFHHFLIFLCVRKCTIDVVYFQTQMRTRSQREYRDNVIGVLAYFR